MILIERKKKKQQAPAQPAAAPVSPVAATLAAAPASPDPNAPRQTAIKAAPTADANLKGVAGEREARADAQLKTAAKTVVAAPVLKKADDILNVSGTNPDAKFSGNINPAIGKGTELGGAIEFWNMRGKLSAGFAKSAQAGILAKLKRGIFKLAPERLTNTQIMHLAEYWQVDPTMVTKILLGAKEGIAKIYIQQVADAYCVTDLKDIPKALDKARQGTMFENPNYLGLHTLTEMANQSAQKVAEGVIKKSLASIPEYKDVTLANYSSTFIALKAEEKVAKLYSDQSKIDLAKLDPAIVQLWQRVDGGKTIDLVGAIKLLNPQLGAKMEAGLSKPAATPATGTTPIGGNPIGQPAAVTPAGGGQGVVTPNTPAGGGGTEEQKPKQEFATQWTRLMKKIEEVGNSNVQNSNAAPANTQAPTAAPANTQAPTAGAAPTQQQPAVGAAPVQGQQPQQPQMTPEEVKAQIENVQNQLAQLVQAQAKEIDVKMKALTATELALKAAMVDSADGGEYYGLMNSTVAAYGSLRIAAYYYLCKLFLEKKIFEGSRIVDENVFLAWVTGISTSKLQSMIKDMIAAASAPKKTQTPPAAAAPTQGGR